MSDRLDDLRRQRELAQQQVAWFDQEIARESGGAVPAAAPPASISPPTGAAKPELSDADKQAEKILERYRHMEHPVRNEVRRGCFIYFFAAFAALALLLGTLYVVHLQREKLEETYPDVVPTRSR